MFTTYMQQEKLVITIKKNKRVLRIAMQKIKIDDLKIIKKLDWLSNSFTTISFLIFLKLLSFNSLHIIELNQTSINQNKILSTKQASNNIFSLLNKMYIYLLTKRTRNWLRLNKLTKTLIKEKKFVNT